MLSLKSNALFILLVIILAGCTKPDTPDDTQSNTPKPGGVLYINVVGDFIKVNVKDSTELWRSRTINLFGAVNNPMTFDSTTFYHGNHSGLTGYNIQTGTVKSTYSWGAFSDAIAYRAPAFKDSLIFYVSPTSVWDHAYLYCRNKNTNALYWSKEIDKGYVSLPFNTAPMVVNDKVIVLTRDDNNHKRLTAYNVTSGAQAWASAINDSLSHRLWLANGKIYAASNQNAICYDAITGALLWQTRLSNNSFDLTTVFFEQDKLIIVKVYGNVYTIFTINIANGVIARQATITTPVLAPNIASGSAMSCNYYNNNLLITFQYSNDSISVRSYNYTTTALMWEKRYVCGFPSTVLSLLTDKYIIVPANSTVPGSRSILYFLDMNGNEVGTVPIKYYSINGFAYVENNNIYQQNNTYIFRNQ